LTNVVRSFDGQLAALLQCCVSAQCIELCDSPTPIGLCSLAELRRMVRATSLRPELGLSSVFDITISPDSKPTIGGGAAGLSRRTVGFAEDD